MEHKFSLNNAVLSFPSTVRVSPLKDLFKRVSLSQNTNLAFEYPSSLISSENSIATSKLPSGNLV